MTKKILYFLVFCLMSSQAFANILISKTYTILDSKRSDILEVTNMSNQKMRYKVKMVNYKQNPDGSYEISYDSDISANELLYVSPKNFILDKRQTQTIRVMKKSSKNKAFKNLADGEYRTHLVVQEAESLDDNFSVSSIEDEKIVKEGGFSIEIEGLMGVSIPVIVRQGDLTSNAKIISAKLEGNELSLKVNRTGNKSVRGDLTIFANNKEIGKATNFAIYTENNSRFIKIPLDLDSLKGKNLKSLRVEYKDVENKKQDILSSYKLTGI